MSFITPNAPSVLGGFKCLNQMYVCDYYRRMSVFVIISFKCHFYLVGK